MEIAIKEERMDDAEATKNRVKFLKLLLPMLRKLAKNGIVTNHHYIDIYKQKKLIRHSDPNFKKLLLSQSTQMKMAFHFSESPHKYLNIGITVLFQNIGQLIQLGGEQAKDGVITPTSL